MKHLEVPIAMLELYVERLTYELDEALKNKKGLKSKSKIKADIKHTQEGINQCKHLINIAKKHEETH